MISWSAPPGLPDAERLVPLGDRLEVRRRRAARRSRRCPAGSSAGVLDDEAGPAVERAPDAERDRERVAALDRPVARAEQPERWRAGRRSASGGRTAASPFQSSRRTASRSVMPGRRPASSRRTPSEVWQAAYSSAASCSTSLMTRRPSAGVDQQVGGVLDQTRSGRSSRAQLVDEDTPGPRSRDRSAYVFQPTTPTRLPGPMPSSARISASGRERSRGWPGRLRSWNRMPAHRQRRGAGHAVALVADEDRRVAVRPDDQERLLEARVEAGQVGEVGAVLAVGVDDEPVVAALVAHRSRRRSRRAA